MLCKTSPVRLRLLLLLKPGARPGRSPVWQAGDPASRRAGAGERCFCRRGQSPLMKMTGEACETGWVYHIDPSHLISSFIFYDVSMEAHVRIHTEMISQDDLMTFVKETAERWYVVLESQATRPHYQMYIHFKQKYKSLNSMRNKLKKILSDKGNRAYSISEVKDRIHLLCYLLKENNTINTSNIPKDWMTQAAARQEEIVSRQSKSRPQTILSQLEDVIPPNCNQNEMAKLMLKFFLSKKRLVPDPGLFKRYLYSIHLQRSPVACVDFLRNLFQFESSPPTLETQAEWLEFFSQDTVQCPPDVQSPSVAEFLTHARPVL